jgi:HPt (histidine-containing phosphotransfer) domain-containing protein
MQAEYKAGNLAQLSETAHNLKGVSASLGALKLSQLASYIDIDCRQKRSELLGDKLAEIQEAVERLQVEVEALGRTAKAKDID